MPKNVIVVGMPRSGTSLVAGLFADRGYFVAEDREGELRAGDQNNPGGYWEAEGLVEANAAVFAAAGFPHHNTWLFDPIGREAAEAIGRLDALPGHADLVASYETHAPWLWKDPRLCYTLSYWWKLVDPAETRVVLTRRSPEAIYLSFLRLGWRQDSPEAREDVFRRIEDHVGLARRTVEDLGIPHAVAEYERFSTDPSGLATEIAACVGLDLDAGSLGFDRRFDHSSGRGRISTALDRMAGVLPGPLRRGIKAMVPHRLLSAIFPERR